MSVTDEQVATLQALLAGNHEEYDRLNAQLGKSTDRRGYTALVAASFFKAAYRRFAKEGTAADVIEFVSDVRSRSADAADQLDPRAAERLLLAVISDEDDLDDMDGTTRIGTQFVLLAALIADQELDETGLNMFMDEARKLAEEWTSQAPGRNNLPGSVGDEPMVEVTDEQVAALRAYLAADGDESVRLHEQLIQSDGMDIPLHKDKQIKISSARHRVEAVRRALLPS